MIEIFLTKVSDNRFKAVKAVRACTKELTGNLPGIRESIEAVDNFDPETPLKLGEAETIEQANAAVSALVNNDCDGFGADSSGELDPLSPEAFFRAEEAAFEGEKEVPASPKAISDLPAYDASQAALILMAVSEGDPSRALSIANTFKLVCFPDFWAEVAKALTDTFPVDERPRRPPMTFQLPPGLRG